MSALAPLDIPLSIEPITGWRVWVLERDYRKRLKLRSVVHRADWVPGAPFRATCDKAAHDAPSSACSCGLYATASIGALQTAGVMSRSTSVIGTVSMWGDVVEHDTGYRSGFAYPSRLRVVCGDCLAQGAGAVDPVIVVTEDRALIGLCEDHDEGDPGVAAREIQDELLATYGVDLLPAPTFPRRPKPGRQGLTSDSIGMRIVEAIFQVIGFVIGAVMFLMIAGWFLSVIIAIASLVIGPFTDDRPAAVETQRVVSDESVVPPDPRSRIPERHGPPVGSSAPAFTLVCGIAHGDVVRQVRCDHESDGLGFATRDQPRGSDEDCAGQWDAYSKGDGWSVCWLFMPPEPEVDRRPVTTNPFRDHQEV